MSVTFFLSNGSDDYSINMSNTNAFEFLEAINREKDLEEWCGRWSKDDIKEILKLLSYAKANPLALTKETKKVGNFVFCGRGLDYVLSRIMQFEMLLTYALNNNLEVNYG